MSYLSQPSISTDTLYFISEDDLWSIPLAEVSSGKENCSAVRMTAGLGAMSQPCVSLDGKWIAVSSEEEGHSEIYVMPAHGGELKRLTYLAALSQPVCWKNEHTLVFKSNAKHAHRLMEFYEVSIEGGLPTPLNLGTGTNLQINAQGEVLIERNSNRSDPSYWKRYKGGTKGQLWVSSGLKLEFRHLELTSANLSTPLWHEKSPTEALIYFLSDESGLGRIYSCKKDGSSLKMHAPSFQSEFYFRNLCTNGKVFAFQSAGDLYLFDPKNDQIQKLNIHLPSHMPHQQRKKVSLPDWMNSYSLQPQGERMLVSARGKVFHFAHWSGAVEQLGNESAIRYKYPEWLADGKRVVLVRDDGLMERIEVHHTETGEVSTVQSKFDFGRIMSVCVSPRNDEVVIQTHREEIVWLDLKTGDVRKIHKNTHAAFSNPSWSPDGRFIAYAKAEAFNRSCIAIYSLEQSKSFEVTDSVLVDYAPSFDSEGKYLYFLSKRVFNPIYDEITFDMTFAKGSVPCLIVLSKNGTSPFVQESPLPEGMQKNPASGVDLSQVKCEIDFDEIKNRVIQFPVAEARYTKIQSAGKKVLWSYMPVEGALDTPLQMNANTGKEFLDCFDFTTGKFEYFGTGITNFQVRNECGIRVVRSGKHLRLVKMNEKADDTVLKEAATAKTGYVDLNRVHWLAEPKAEWVHMFKDAWRQQKEYFWREDLNGMDWDAVYRRYEPVLKKIKSRREFSDLIWELIGELGTSHSYERGGDHRVSRMFDIGKLGADFEWSESPQGYRITKILAGDRWNLLASSPLHSPGVNLKVGDVIQKIAGISLKPTLTPHQALLGKSAQEVHLEFIRKGAAVTEKKLIRVLKDEVELLYREWVDGNRRKVKELSQGKLGYVHIPNMVGKGYAEFYRGFLYENECEGLVLDVRYNTGGHISQLIIDKLMSKSLGKSESRWLGTHSIPYEAPPRTIVAITNEFAGSDGDIFSHTFKMRKLGKLIGTRTWGGVVGIWPRNHHYDGGWTSQAEFATWFEDVEYGLENYGTDPDIFVPFAPHEKEDPQLKRAVEEALKDLSDYPR